MKSIRRTIGWLGPTRANAIFFLLAGTGLLSLMLNAVGAQAIWVRPVQSALLIVFLVGAAFIVISRFPPDDRRQLRIAVTPAILSVSLGFLFPNYLFFFGPVGIGWLFIALILMRGRVRPEYQTAIKHMRNNEYDEAIKVMTDLIKVEPENPDHRRFRAELFRLSGKIKRARADYEKVIELTPESGVGYNGLAEVYLQDSEFEQALVYARQALEHEPDSWVAPYNLGMIEDRLSMATEAIEHLQQALNVGIPDSRHRLLTHLWLARSYYRQGKPDEATAELQAMKREKTGLNEWGTIFESDAAAVLRAVLEDDVTLAGRLVNDEAAVSALAGAASS
ncbi:MAG: tetratricopeptide repeat protein [Chloroflexota bacterium]